MCVYTVRKFLSIKIGAQLPKHNEWGFEPQKIHFIPNQTWRDEVE